MVGLGDLSGGDFYSNANAVSADGSVVVGYSKSDSGNEAFIWDAENGMRNLKELLIAGGVEGLDGWQLTMANDISSDGRFIVGRGINPSGIEEAWLASVPEPSTFVLFAAFGLVGAFVAWRKRKRT